MNKPLQGLRFALVGGTGFLSMYIYEYANTSLFTLHLLIALLLFVLSGRVPGKLGNAQLLAEAVWSLWLVHQYGGLLVFVSLSPLLAYLRLQPVRLPMLLAAVQLAALNAVCRGEEPLVLAFVNLAFILTAVLGIQFHRAGRGQADMLLLYDELRKRHFELDQARKQLLQFAAQVENTAQIKERTRIARNLHDDLGHRLIRIKLMTEAAIHTGVSSPEAGLEMMGSVRDQLAEGMDELRRTVQKIDRSSRLEQEYNLKGLLEETGRDTGIVTSYTVTGQPFPLYPSLQIVLYRNAREAITNALRHGQATSVSVTLHYGQREIAMEIANNGTLPDNWKEGHGSHTGMGIAGMEERAQLIGGSMEWRLTPTFTVTTRLPVYEQQEIV